MIQYLEQTRRLGAYQVRTPMLWCYCLRAYRMRTFSKRIRIYIPQILVIRRCPETQKACPKVENFRS